MSDNEIAKKEESLAFHAANKKGKIHISLNKQLNNKKDLSIAYSPGVAYPCLEIARDKNLAYEYTAKGNFVAVISNGTAVLGLGNLGGMASKPVMEGKSVLFKKFADIDSVDVEVDSTNTEDIIKTIKNIGETWGGINLEDIASPECFIIETELKKQLDIPVFHDDQHGTAIISLAGLINACEITGRDIRNIKVVVNGAGAAGLSCINLMKLYGVKPENILACDRTGVVYEGREKDMNEWKATAAVKTDKRTLQDALDGADVVFGLSVKGAISKDMIKKMAPNPIIFALANPDPEITPEDAKEVRPDCIIATGRSDYPNQINNVIGFPYIFRGALDVRASKITENMKLAAAKAISDLTKEQVPDEIKSAYPGTDLSFGREYIVPTPFDYRLIAKVSSAVAKAAIEDGVARKKIDDWEEYEMSLLARINPNSHLTNLLFNDVDIKKSTVAFVDGEDPRSINAAVMWRNNNFGTAVLIGREEKINTYCKEHHIKSLENISIVNASNKQDKLKQYADILYKKQQRNGLNYYECESLVKTDANIFGSLLLESKEVDAIITGLRKNPESTIKKVGRVIEGEDTAIGITIVLSKNKLLFIGNTAVHHSNIEQDEVMIDDVFVMTDFIKKFSIKPKVAFIGSSNFGAVHNEISANTQELISILSEFEKNEVDFEYDGEMTISTALDYIKLKEKYPFTRLTAEPNLLIAPDNNIANIIVDTIKAIDKSSTIIGSILLGMDQSVQICNQDATANDLFNLATVAVIS